MALVIVVLVFGGLGNCSREERLAVSEKSPRHQKKKKKYHQQSVFCRGSDFKDKINQEKHYVLYMF